MKWDFILRSTSQLLENIFQTRKVLKIKILFQMILLAVAVAVAVVVFHCQIGTKYKKYFINVPRIG